MKKILFMLLGGLMLLTGYSPVSKKEGKHIATCYGNKTCYACKNCKYCAHCNSGGGNCGVCQTKRSIPIKSTGNTSTSSSQCKATTKKGARCKRMVKGGGCCWQHS